VARTPEGKAGSVREGIAAAPGSALRKGSLSVFAARLEAGQGRVAISGQATADASGTAAQQYA